MHIDLQEIIKSIGYVGLFGIVFAESGLFFGFFLPGDSLLVTAGLLATQGFFDIATLILLLTLAAVMGDSVGYWTGKKFGKSLFRKEKSLFFDKKHIERSHAFFEKHGGKALILARFVPIVRTFAPIVAGAGEMHYKKFLVFNVLGGIFWATGMLLIGYFLGSVIPDVDKYLLPIIAIIIIVSLLPAMLESYRAHRGRVFAKFMDLVSKFPIKF
jgi:membrane-associated protein